MATVQYLLPLGFIIFMVIGLIFLGVATPTEAAATGTLGSFILALIYRRLKWEIMKKSVMGTIKVTTMIFMIIIVSSTYGEILAFTGAASGMTSYITSLPSRRLRSLIGMLIVVLILGCFMETVAIMMITIPIYMAVVNAFGIQSHLVRRAHAYRPGDGLDYASLWCYSFCHERGRPQRRDYGGYLEGSYPVCDH